VFQRLLEVLYVNERRRGLTPRPEAIEFGREILRRDIQEYERAHKIDGPAFFDRGIGDALCMLYNCNGMDMSEVYELNARYPYSSPVFVLPPWKSIFVNDSERDQTFEEAMQISERLMVWHVNLGYSVLEVPFGTPEQRVAFILRTTGLGLA